MGVMLYELCALKVPFDAPSIQMLSMKIVRGIYAPISTSYSTGLRNLVKELLQTTPSRRPTVNKILKLPLIQDRIKSNLTNTVIQTEFSHTILHKQNVYDAARKPPEAKQE